MEYSAIERYQLLLYATTWMNPGGMLSEGSQSQKGKYCVTLDDVPIKLSNILKQTNIRNGVQTSGCHGLWVGGEVTIKGLHEGVFWGYETVLNPNCGRSYRNLNMC